VCGNPRPKSRTLEAALFVAERLFGRPPDVVLDLVELGPHLLGWGDPAAAAAVESVRRCAFAVVASPT
jgi:FMN reductase